MGTIVSYRMVRNLKDRHEEDVEEEATVTAVAVAVAVAATVTLTVAIAIGEGQDCVGVYSNSSCFCLSKKYKSNQ